MHTEVKQRHSSCCRTVHGKRLEMQDRTLMLSSDGNRPQHVVANTNWSNTTGPCPRLSSGALHRSVLGLFFCNTFTNALQEVTKDLLISFPGDIRLGRQLLCLQEGLPFRCKGLVWLEEQADRDLMKSYKDKCKILHLGWKDSVQQEGWFGWAANGTWTSSKS